MPTYTQAQLTEIAAVEDELRARSPADRQTLLTQLRIRRNETDRGKRVTPFGLTWDDLDALEIQARRFTMDEWARDGQTAATRDCPGAEVDRYLYHGSSYPLERLDAYGGFFPDAAYLTDDFATAAWYAQRSAGKCRSEYPDPSACTPRVYLVRADLDRVADCSGIIPADTFPEGYREKIDIVQRNAQEASWNSLDGVKSANITPAPPFVAAGPTESPVPNSTLVPGFAPLGVH